MNWQHYNTCIGNMTRDPWIWNIAINQLTILQQSCNIKEHLVAILKQMKWQYCTDELPILCRWNGNIKIANITTNKLAI